MRESKNHNHSDRRKPSPATAVGAALARSDSPARARIAKVISRAGLCSRRDAETWIRAGRVSVNGVTLTSPAHNVAASDTIYVDGVQLEGREPTRLFLFHKPRGCVTTTKDPQHRPTVFGRLPKDLPRLIAVGRLDFSTQGLLLLTNDGGLARVLELPKTGWLRRYRVRANGTSDQSMLDKLAGGLTIDGTRYGPIEARLDRVQGANVWLTIGLREGKNREVKRVLESLGLIVNRLIRVSFGPFQLGDLAEGAVQEVKTRVLREQLGEAVLRAAQVDFASPRSSTLSGRRQFAENESAPQPPRRGRPEPGKRKHISVLRAERRATLPLSEPLAHGTTVDRKGRRIAVERLVARDPANGAPTATAGREPTPAGANRRGHLAAPKKPPVNEKRRWSQRRQDERGVPQKTRRNRRADSNRSYPPTRPRK
jgi:23S rRNA pseudouridine2605 synthase